MIAFVPYFATVETTDLKEYRYYEDGIYICYEESNVGTEMTIDKVESIALGILNKKLKLKGNILELFIDTSSIDIKDE